ncbi:MAG: hypothetical protein K0S29_876 [Gammaproteobacteria bacterium]|jgi:ElaB/YqjD/DUF883 family membrane-anchored ribosome-binding protein|nr:hypothetical protein [Gammaproteobacteria bacterium]
MAIDNVQKAKHHLEEANQHAKHEYETAKAQAKAKLSDVNESLQKGCEKVKGYVKSNPLTALGIAVAVGMGVSALLSRGK